MRTQSSVSKFKCQGSRTVGLVMMSTVCMLSGAASNPVGATEGSVYGGPIGGTDTRSAYLPPSTGLYAAGVLFPYTSHELVGNDGNKSVANFKYTGITAAATVLYVYPFTLAGGTVASSIQWVGSDRYGQIGSRTEYKSGIGDIYSDILRWSKYEGTAAEAPSGRRLPYGLTWNLNYSMIFPTGDYSTTSLFTSGHNDYFYIPNAAVTYLTSPEYPLGADGTEISARFFYDSASKNPATHYKSGDVADVDFAVSERYGQWQAGLAGTYAEQLFDDKQKGAIVSPQGKYLDMFKLGPVMNYDVPNSSISMKAKLLTPVFASNTSIISSVVFVVSMKLF